MPVIRCLGVLPLILVLGACNRSQSAFAVFGREAAELASLTLVLTVGAVLVAIFMAALIWKAVRAPEGSIDLAGGERMILWLGGVVPAVLLLGLLAYSLPLMRPRKVAPAALQVVLEGEQFWWRVRYQAAGAVPVVSANELRLPVGRDVVLRLRAGDVVHSFWVPGLAGKTDMIPGRENRMTVRATKAGVYRGQCTEFCGLSHALMAFDVVAMEPADFDRWLADQAATVRRTDALFAGYGCGGCHAVRGTEAAGRIGPDLTHFGARRTLGAGILPPTEANVAAFIRHPERFKAGVRMPAFGAMPERDARAIARYLKALK